MNIATRIDVTRVAVSETDREREKKRESERADYCSAVSD